MYHTMRMYRHKSSSCSSALYPIVLFQKLSATAHVITSRFSFGGFGCSRNLFAYIDCAEGSGVCV